MKKFKSMPVGLAALAVGLLTAGWARAGSLDAPASPTNPASAMFTLNDIYNKLDVRSNVVVKRTGGFAEPTAGPTNESTPTLNDIMTLVTNRAPAMKTGQTNSGSVAYDDGALKMGVAWPTNRFTVGTGTVVNTTNCVMDNLTGLMWVRNPSNYFTVVMGMSWATNWGAALTNCNNMDYGGYDDWRLPNIRELYSLVDAGRSGPALPAGHPFINIQWATIYWSSTSTSATSMRSVDLNTGMIGQPTDVNLIYYVWPVRGGEQ